MLTDPLSHSQSPSPPQQGLLSLRPAGRWENGFVTGNGTLGAIAFGIPDHEIIIGNDSRLFLPLRPTSALPADSGDFLVARRFLPDIASLLPEVRAAIQSEGSPAGYVTAQKLVWDEAKRQGYNGYQFPGNYHAGFKLHLDMPAQGAVRDYRRTVDFAKGEVGAFWRDDRGSFERRLFSSRPAQVIAGVIRGSKGGIKADFKLGTFADMSLATMESSVSEDGWLIQIARYEHGELENNGGYVSAIRVIARNGKMRAAGGTLSVEDAEEVLLFMKIQPFAFAEKPPVERLRAELSQLPQDYDLLLRAHEKEHGSLFGRCALDLGGGADRAAPVEDLLARGREDGIYPPALSEKLYDVCRYAVLCSTGVYPPGGKGLWIGQWQDEWNTVYTLDANLELEMASVLSANLPELMGSLAEFMMNDRIMADHRTNARKIFGTRGIQLPQTRWPDCALNVAWGRGISSGQYWTAGAAWFSSLFYDYYLYTGDKKFLRERLVPFMKETAEFYEDYLKLDASGKYRFSPAWSPENGILAGAGDNPTMDIAACKELLTNLITSCQELGLHAAEIPKWQEMIKHLPPYMINGDGALAEWAFAGSVDIYSHRHASHLYPVWRSREITAATPELFRAARVATDKRIGAGGEDGSTHGFIILALTEIMLGNGNGAHFQLKKMLQEGYYYDNLLTAHFAEGKVLWIDGTGAWDEIVNSMLVASEPGTLELLPALPDALPRGTVRGMLARRQLHLNQLAWDVAAGTLQLEVTSAIDQTITVSLPKRYAVQSMRAKGFDPKSFASDGNRGKLALSAGEKMAVAITWLPEGTANLKP